MSKEKLQTELSDQTKGEKIQGTIASESHKKSYREF